MEGNDTFRLGTRARRRGPVHASRSDLGHRGGTEGYNQPDGRVDVHLIVNLLGCW